MSDAANSINGSPWALLDPVGHPRGASVEPLRKPLALWVPLWGAPVGSPCGGLGRLGPCGYPCGGLWLWGALGSLCVSLWRLLEKPCVCPEHIRLCECPCGGGFGKPLWGPLLALGPVDVPVKSPCGASCLCFGSLGPCGFPCGGRMWGGMGWCGKTWTHKGLGAIVAPLKTHLGLSGAT